MNDLSKPAARPQVRTVAIGEEAAEQRIDNFLLRQLKGVPKSHVYRVLRSGEVRVNSGRVKPDYRLKVGDRVRIPPVRVSAEKPKASAATLYHGSVSLFEQTGFTVQARPTPGRALMRLDL